MFEWIKQQIISADLVGFWLFLLGLATLCGLSLYGIFRYFHRGRIIDDTPTSKIRSAHQGFVELEGRGRLMKGTPIVSPLSGMQCLWYSYTISKKNNDYSSRGYDLESMFNRFGSGSEHWETVRSETSDDLFLLADETGICVIDPDGATITPSFSKTWYGSSANAMASSPSNNRFFGGHYQYKEKRIDVGADLYVLGRFKSIGGRREKLDKSGEVRELLAKWKTRPNFLLAHFDENGDGEIDVQEWQKVMAAAEQEVENSFSERLVQPEIHTVSKPIDSRRPFIISVESQESISKRYKWYSRGSIFGFFFCGISLVWAIGIRLSQ